MLKRRVGNGMDMLQEWIREGQLRNYLRVNLMKAE